MAWFPKTVSLAQVVEEVQEGKRPAAAAFDEFPDLGVRQACLKRLGTESTGWILGGGKIWCEMRLTAIAGGGVDPIGQPLLDFYLGHSFYDPNDETRLAVALDFAVNTLAGRPSFPEFDKAMIGVLTSRNGREAYPKTQKVWRYIQGLLQKVPIGPYNKDHWSATRRALRAIRAVQDERFVPVITQLIEDMENGSVGTEYEDPSEPEPGFRRKMHVEELKVTSALLATQ